MAPRTRFSAKRQPSTGTVMAWRSCDDLGTGVDKKSSELPELNNEQNQKLKLYNFNIEQQNLISAIHSLTFSKNVAGEGLRSAEQSLATLVEPFYHSLNPHLKKKLNQDAKTQGFPNFLLFLKKNPVLARAVIIKKFPLAELGC